MKYFSVFNRQKHNKKWYTISNGIELAEVMIYNEIGSNGIQAAEFVEELNQIKSPTIKLRLNTPGGDVFDGIAIFNALKSHPAKIETHIEGLAASIGSVIALAGDTVYMSKSGHYMIHNVWGAALGDAGEFRKAADRLDKIGESIVNIYTDRTGRPAEQVKAWMNNETWFSADEAKAAGFVDEITGENTIKARFDLSVYDKAPAELQAEQAAIVADIRSFETALRDEFGFSHSAAKKLAAHGWPAYSRDGQDEGVEDVVSFIKQLQNELTRR